MKAGPGIVELIYKGERSDVDRKSAFLVNFAPEIVVKRVAGFDAATGRRPQVGPVARVGIDQQKATFVNDDCACGEAG